MMVRADRAVAAEAHAGWFRGLVVRQGVFTCVSGAGPEHAEGAPWDFGRAVVVVEDEPAGCVVDALVEGAVGVGCGCSCGLVVVAGLGVGPGRYRASTGEAWVHE